MRVRQEKPWMSSAIFAWLIIGDIWKLTIPHTSSRRIVISPRFWIIITLTRNSKPCCFSAIQTIEVAIRTKIIKHFTLTFGAFWFMDERLAGNPDFFHSNLEHIRTEVKRSREEFITEHFLKYAEPDLPPVWKTLEVVSFGTLSKLFGNFKDATAKHQVAREFGLNHHKFLKSWMETLVALRNYCAHHSRVWNRRFPVKPQTPRRMPQDWISDFSFRQETIYPHLCCITYGLNSIYPKNTFVADFKAMLEKHPSVSTRLMGFPAHWEESRCGSKFSPKTFGDY